MPKLSTKDNELLVDFNFVIDLDIAMYKYIQNKYADSIYVDDKLMHSKNDYAIINLMIHRVSKNPLQVLMPTINPDNIYNEIVKNDEAELLKFARPYDSFYLLVTYLVHAASVGITVLCNNELESNFIKSIDSRVNTIICNDWSALDISKYTVLYIKYFSDLIKFKKEIAGKYIYISSARYNYDKDNRLDKSLIILYGDINIIKFMDLYTKVIYVRETNKGDDKDDLLEHSSTEESEGDPEGDAWYNFRFSE